MNYLTHFLFNFSADKTEPGTVEDFSDETVKSINILNKPHLERKETEGFTFKKYQAKEEIKHQKQDNLNNSNVNLEDILNEFALENKKKTNRGNGRVKDKAQFGYWRL